LLSAPTPGRSKLDGVYLEYDPVFLTDARFSALCAQMPVGIWGRAGLDPDNIATATRLVEQGARFVNTDLPKDFFHQAEAEDGI